MIWRPIRYILYVSTPSFHATKKMLAHSYRQSQVDVCERHNNMLTNRLNLRQFSPTFVCARHGKIAFDLRTCVVYFNSANHNKCSLQVIYKKLQKMANKIVQPSDGERTRIFQLIHVERNKHKKGKCDLGCFIPLLSSVHDFTKLQIGVYHLCTFL